jgi:hypothetical protein
MTPKEDVKADVMFVFDFPGNTKANKFILHLHFRSVKRDNMK